MNDNELMLKVKQGDFEKLGLIYERHKKRLYNYFYKLNNDSELSKDLVQNVFIRVLKFKHKYKDKGEESFISWLFKIARNENYTHYRKSKKHLEKVEFKTENHNDLIVEALDKKILLNEEKKLLKIALNRLSENKKEVLILSKYQELPYRDIAKILNCTEASVKVQVYRALKELKIIMQKLNI